MLNVSTAFKQKLYNDERAYLNTLQITLKDNTRLTIDNVHIMSNGVSFEDAVGEDNSFTSLGATVCNSFTAILYNLDDTYSDYVFEGAKCTWYVGLNVPNGNTETPEMLKKGVFTVDSATYNDYTVTLTMLDNMEQFDRPYSMSTLTYPATLDAIVRDACSICGVTLATNSLQFPHRDYSVATRPEDGSTTFREVISWCATIAGRFARCNADGELELKWFNTSAFEEAVNYDGGIFDSSNPYSTGANINGGTFNPWNDVATIGNEEFTTPIPLHYITSLNTQSFGVDDIIITGVKIRVRIEDTTQSASEQEFSTGTDNYIVEVSDNPFITVDTAPTVLSWLATQLIGLQFRQCNVTHPNDPTIEAGDVGLIWDRNGDEHNVLVTRVTFAPNELQTIVCGAETVSKNQSTRVSSQTKSYIEARKQLRQQRNEYQAAMDDLRDAIENADGLYETDVVQQDSSVIRYLHNKPDLADSDIQIVISNVGVTMTPDGGDHWYGLRVDGTLIASILNTIGINADWINSGTLTITDSNGVETFYANTSTGTVRIKASVFSLNGDTIQDIASASATTAANAAIAGQTQTDIFNKLTNNGQAQGIYLQNGQLYISFNYAKGGTLTLGGNNNVSGTLIINDRYNDTRALFNNESLYMYETTNNYFGTDYQDTLHIIGTRLNFYDNLNINRAVASLVFSHSFESGSSDVYDELSMFGRDAILRLHTSSGSYKRYYAQIPTDLSGIPSSWEGYHHIFSGKILIFDSTYIDDSVTITGSISVRGNKSRQVSTESYSDRLLYCYETPSPLFGDIGEGVIGEDGKCYVWLDPIFAQTIRTSNYQVFLQSYSPSSVYVLERTDAYFVVCGEPGAKFGWELKAKQADYAERRMDIVTADKQESIDYGQLAENHITELSKGRYLE